MIKKRQYSIFIIIINICVLQQRLTHNPVYNYLQIPKQVLYSNPMYSPLHPIFIIFQLLSLSIIASAQTEQDKKITSLEQCRAISKLSFINQLSASKVNTQLEQTLQRMFPADKNLLVGGILAKKISNVKAAFNGKEGDYVINLGIIALIGLIHVILLPLLFCTRCCTRCCQPAARKAYTKCELYWPVILAIILILGLVGICADLININRNFQQKFTKMKCGVAIISDDLLEGGTYDDQTIKFLGLRNFRFLFNNFTDKLTSSNDFAQSFSSKSKLVDNISKQIQLIETKLKKIPTEDGSPLILQYSNPLTSLSTNSVSRQVSKFPSVLGTSNKTGTLLGNLSQTLNEQKSKIGEMTYYSGKLSNISKNIDKSGIRQRLGGNIQAVENIQFNIINTLSLFQKGFLMVYRIGSYVLLGVTILFAILMCFSLICLTCNRVYSQRNGLLFCCVVMWVIGIVHFGMAIGYTLGSVGLLYTCQYTRQGLNSQKDFKNNFINPLFSEYTLKQIEANITNNTNSTNNTSNQTFPSRQNSTSHVVIDFNNITLLISKCLPASDDPFFIYNSIMKEDFQNITKLAKIIPNISNLQPYGLYLYNNYSNVLSKVYKYQTAEIMDIDSPEMINELRTMAKNQQCFPDNWVPNLNQELIPCPNNKSKIANSSTCQTKTEFQLRSDSCTGCMDTYQILENYNTRNEVQQSLTLRYGECINSNKQGLIENLTNIWENYYFPKKEIIGKVQQKITALNQSFSTSQILMNKMGSAFSQSVDKLKNIQLLKLSKQNNLLKQSNITNEASNSSNSALNQNLAIKDSMDCRVFGKAILNAMNYACNEGLYQVYMLRTFYILTALLIFFLCTLVICATSRFYQQHHTNQNNENNREQNDNGAGQPNTEVRLNSN